MAPSISRSIRLSTPSASRRPPQLQALHSAHREPLDLLGNRLRSTSVAPHLGGSDDTFKYDSTARLSYVSRPPQVGDTTFYHYDEWGNTYEEERHVWSFAPDGVTRRQQVHKTWSSYDADSRLVRADFTIDSLRGTTTLPPGQAVRYQSTEEYRYDALGRRIWIRTRRDTTCWVAERPSGCFNSVTRVLWDGDQIGGEIRNGTYQNAAAGDIDNDATSDSVGQVRYVHNGVIDRPLAVAKRGKMTVHPLSDWRGAIGEGICKSGINAAVRCNSAEVRFPMQAGGIFGSPNSLNMLGPPSFYGSLIEGMKDGTGKIYQRNRYLDPETGRFTQEDPIGLAGGMNLYGFAGGDPVNFSDPFGLCASEADSIRVTVRVQCADGTTSQVEVWAQTDYQD